MDFFYETGIYILMVGAAACVDALVIYLLMTRGGLLTPRKRRREATSLEAGELTTAGMGVQNSPLETTAQDEDSLADLTTEQPRPRPSHQREGRPGQDFVLAGSRSKESTVAQQGKQGSSPENRHTADRETEHQAEDAALDGRQGFTANPSSGEQYTEGEAGPMRKVSTAPAGEGKDRILTSEAEDSTEDEGKPEEEDGLADLFGMDAEQDIQMKELAQRLEEVSMDELRRDLEEVWKCAMT